MSDAGAQCRVRAMPHRMGDCLDIDVADSGPAIRATLGQNPNLYATGSDQEAITLAIQRASGTGTPTCGIRLWLTVANMRGPDGILQIHSGIGLLTMYGAAEPQVTEAELRQGTVSHTALVASCGADSVDSSALAIR